MARLLSKDEKPLDWVGSSKKDYLSFPEPVKDAMGNALGLAQFGGAHPSAKPWKGQGPGVFEVIEDYDGDTYRAVYTVTISKRSFMCCTLSRRSRPKASRRRGPTSTSSRDD